MKANMVSEFYSEDGNRKTIIWQDKYHWIVDLYENNLKVETRLVTEKTLRFAEDLAENYVEYVGEFKK